MSFALLAEAQTRARSNVGPTSETSVTSTGKQRRRIDRLIEEAQYDKALRVAKNLVSSTKERAGRTSIAYANAISLEAFVHLQKSDTTRARSLYEEALQIYRNRKADPQTIANVLNSLGHVHIRDGQDEEAERAFKESHAIFQEHGLRPNTPLFANNLINFALIEAIKGNDQEAEKLAFLALEIRERHYPKNAPILAATRQNLAKYIESQAEKMYHDKETRAYLLKKAEDYLREAVQIRQTSQKPNHPELAGALQRLGINLYKQRKHADAAHFLIKAVQIRRQSDTFLIDRARALTDLAQIYIVHRKPNVARPLLQEALKIYQQTLPKSHTYVAEIYRDLAYVEEDRRKIMSALSFSRKASNVYISRGTRDRNAQLQFQNHIRYAWKARALVPARAKQALLEEAMTIAQRATITDTAETVSLVGARLSINNQSLRGIIRKRQDLRDEFLLRERRLVSALSSAATSSEARRLRNTIDRIESRIKRLDQRLRKEFPEYYSLVRPAPLTAGEIQALLERDEALVFFLTTYDQVFVWAINPRRAGWAKLDIKPQQLSKAIRTLRKSLEADDFDQLIADDALFDLGKAHELYRRLFGPIEKLIQSQKEITLVSTGALTSLPYNVLVTTEPRTKKPSPQRLSDYAKAAWFVKKWATNVIPSVPNLKSLKQASKSKPAPKSLIGFGNPLFKAESNQSIAPDTRPRPDGAAQIRNFSNYWRRSSSGPGTEINLERLRELTPLPGTERELQAIARNFGGDVEIHLGAKASETAVKNARLADYRVVYFATHALVAGNITGLGEPALVFSLPKTASATDDGLLTTSEIVNLNLNADWVILSACNTAAGAQQGAEALSGLANAFFYSGSRALLVSHWDVFDDATAALMTSVFKNMRGSPGLSRAGAVQKAMLALMKNPSKKWNAYPSSWAPFFVVGTREPS